MSNFIKQTSDAMSKNYYKPKFESNDDSKGNYYSDNDELIFEDQTPVMSAKVTLISGNYEDNYLPEDNLTGFRNFFKIPAIQVIFVAGLGVIVMILVFVALS